MLSPKVYYNEIIEDENEGLGETEDMDPDDELLDETPWDVIDILGFDPKEFDEE